MSDTKRLHFILAAGLAAAGLVLAAAAADMALPPQGSAPANTAASASTAVPANPPAPAAPQAAGATLAQANKPSVSTRAPIRPAQVRNAPAPRPESSPTWAELTAQQQQSLAPLAATWRVLGEAHKRKWLALSQNYPTMPPGEQARLHSRMAEWAALSPQQRTLARLNFAESQKLNTDDKRAKWEAYQNLPPEEKRKLAAGAAAAKPPPTAIAVQPVPQQKLTRIPKPKKAENSGSKIAVVPGRLDSNTLLPKPPAPSNPQLAKPPAPSSALPPQPPVPPNPQLQPPAPTLP